MDREGFLARVGRSTVAAVLPEGPRVAARLPTPDPVDLLTLFRSRAQAVNVVLHGPMTRHGVPRAVTGIAAGHGASAFVAWDDLPVPGVTSALAAVGLEQLGGVVPVQGRAEHMLSYRDLDVGVTGATCGLAESGSIVLSHGEGRPRLASLVPEVHIALLDTSTIVRTLADWAHENPDSVAVTTNLVVVTGPSRTGDIEQTLNLGVHGPRHVHIVMMR